MSEDEPLPQSPKINEKSVRVSEFGGLNEVAVDLQPKKISLFRLF